jgi:hypothetical protein
MSPKLEVSFATRSGSANRGGGLLADRTGAWAMSEALVASMVTVTAASTRTLENRIRIGRIL